MNLNQYNMHLSKLNTLIKGTTYENLSLFETIRQASVRFEDRSIYEHATQVYSNQLFLESYVSFKMYLFLVKINFYNRFLN